MFLEKLFFFIVALAACSSTIYGLLEEDIMLTPEQQATLEVTANPADPFAPQNAVVRSTRQLWPNGVIPYVLDNLNSQAVNAINEAMADYTRLTCIRFVQRTNEQDYVRFFPGNGCFSFIGRIGGPQDISIGRNCEFKGIVIHEIFHALGRWHEQSRPDRDMYVRILQENILSGQENNFEVTNPAFVTTQGVPYDIGSIMHYRSTAFSRNGQPTILPINTNILASSLGQRNSLSNSDLQHVTTLYCSGDQGSASWSTWTTWSQCTRTCNGGTRSRTRTCVGGTTCEGSNIQTQQCNTASCPLPPSWSQWGAWGSCTVSCGRGRQSRSRSCLRGTTCQGIMTQFRDCNTQDCPQPATWGSWGSWSSCSRTCQGGFRQRSRTCQNGNTCPGSSVGSESCNSNIPCVTQPTTNQWSSWSDCSAQCGGGQRFRTLLCGSNNCDTQTESCNTRDCEPEPELKGLVHRGCWYLNAQARIIGSLERTTDDLSDDPRTRERPVSKCGFAALGIGYRIFALTLGGYCVTGSNRLSDYQYYPSRLCSGRGSYNRGWYIMDVYEVTNQMSFSESVIQVANGTSTQTTDKPSEKPLVANSTEFVKETSETDSKFQNVFSSGYKSTYSIITILAFLLASVAM